VLLHGFLSSNLQWELQRPAFDRAFHWFAAELWGHGGSPAPDDPRAYASSGYVEAFEALRKARGIDRWLLVGQSLGAGVMVRYALARPEVVTGLVVTNSLSAFTEVATEAVLPSQDAVATMDLRTMRVHPCHASRFPEDLRRRMADSADRADRVALWRAMTETLRSTCSRDEVAKLSMPVLLVNGTRERAFQPHRDFAASAIPGIQVVDLDAGHAVNVEAPAGFESAVLEFASRVGR
jgi:2-succinyl-6-hydroxy-2,4-cyclohexadiene-1-carboxylate synthase